LTLNARGTGERALGRYQTLSGPVRNLCKRTEPGTRRRPTQERKHGRLSEGQPKLRDRSLSRLLAAEFVKVFRCRAIAAVRHPLGPASESLQGKNPRERGVDRPASAMVICG